MRVCERAIMYSELKLNFLNNLVLIQALFYNEISYLNTLITSMTANARHQEGMQPPKNAFLSAKGLWRTELLVNIKCIKI